jgi:glyoxylase-like metal-dependent hydrolase (beta-lactamase superfamily II)
MKKSSIIKLSLLLVIIAAFLFVAYTTYKNQKEALPVAVKVFEAPKPSKSSWEQVFKSPAPVKVEKLQTGSVQIKKTGKPYSKQHSKGTGGRNVEFKIFSYLIHHQRFGNFLIDAGLNSSVRGNLHGNLKDTSGNEIIYIKKKEMDAASQLKKKNIIPKGIFLTHLNYDNTSGLYGFPSDVQCFIEKNETNLNYKFIKENECFKKFNYLNQLDFTEAPVMEPLGQALDILGDGSLWAVYTPGNTEGRVSYLINGDRPFLIAGDTGIIKYANDYGIDPASFSGNIKVAEATFNLIVKFNKLYPQVKLLFEHEI